MEFLTSTLLIQLVYILYSTSSKGLIKLLIKYNYYGSWPWP